MILVVILVLVFTPQVLDLNPSMHGAFLIPTLPSSDDRGVGVDNLDLYVLIQLTFI